MKKLIAMQAENGVTVSRRGGVGKHAQCLSALVLTVGLSQSMVDAAEPKMMASFNDPTTAGNWVSVNDGVMGGVSKGGFELTADNTLLFTGNLSLENNGGFASIRTQPSTMDLSGLTGVEVRVRGDGRSYSIDLRGDRQGGGSSYRAYLPAPEGAWVTAIIPLSEFKLQSYGRQLEAGPVDPSTIRSVGFMLADKKEGAFRLEIESVKAVFENGQPETGTSIVEVASASGNFQTLLAAATAADLADVLAGDGPFTVFAPTDEAFAQLPEGTLEQLLKPEGKSALVGILKYHVVSGRVSLAQVLDAKQAPTLQGETVSASFEDGRVKIGSATLVKADIPASNGIIHVIDEVLLPPDETATAPLTPTSLIELAIERGVPLFNDGNPGACAAVYEVTCQALRAMPDLDEDSINDVEKALTAIRTENSHTRQAWILRHALDRVYARLST